MTKKKRLVVNTKLVSILSKNLTWGICAEVVKDDREFTELFFLLLVLGFFIFDLRLPLRRGIRWQT